VTTKGDVFIIRTAQGDYGKFQILYYAEGVYELRIAPVARTVSSEQRVIDASAGWTYYSFVLDRTIEPVNPATDLSWDIALNAAMVQTNSGTSGAGNGGALDPSQANLSAIATAPASGYTLDTQLDIDGNAFSGSAVLNGWYQSGTTTPNDSAYLLRSADGTFAKMKIGAYDSGSYTIDWAYAGPGHTDF
jgi:hypothetical protein